MGPDSISGWCPSGSRSQAAHTLSPERVAAGASSNQLPNISVRQGDEGGVVKLELLQVVQETARGVGLFSGGGWETTRGWAGGHPMSSFAGYFLSPSQC